MFLEPTGGEVASCPLIGPGLLDLAMGDFLARWQLAARRRGGAIHLRDMSEELEALLDLAGLLGEVGGEPECVEQAGVEEGVGPGDPPA